MRLFEAAGRLASFRRAAEEANVTPSAVSHAVRGLEDWLGADLFVRDRGSLYLTDFGAAYLAEIQAALARISQATRARPDRRRPRPLSCSVAPSFALRWLLPRLQAFRAEAPEVEVRLDTATEAVDFARSGVDLAIRMAPVDQAADLTYFLTREQLVPVAAPEAADGIREVGDLRGHTLLHVTRVSEDWDTWLRQSGADLPPDCRHLRFDRIHMALDAAAAGLGVAIGRVPLIESDLAAGRLVPVLGPPRECRTAYWLALSEPALRHPGAQAFKRWIMRELRAPGTGPAQAPE